MLKRVQNGVSIILAGAVLLILATICRPEPGRAELHWQATKKQPIHVRLVALAWNHLPSSFFPNQEVFIAEKQLAPQESQLIKLVYGYLLYQPPLSEYGLDYSIVHEVDAVRDPDCDETLSHMTAGETGDWHRSYHGLRYSSDAPFLNPNRHKAPLPCYLTSAEDYHGPLH